MQPLNQEQIDAFAAKLNDEGDKSVFLDLAAKGDWKTLNGHFPDAYKGVKAEDPAAPEAPEAPAAPEAPKRKATKKAGK